MVRDDHVRLLFEAFGAETECRVTKNYWFVYIDSESASQGTNKGQKIRQNSRIKSSLLGILPTALPTMSSRHCSRAMVSRLVY